MVTLQKHATISGNIVDLIAQTLSEEKWTELDNDISE